ncbi:MAG: hypothetical protein EXR69_08915 [Myxococcales bacterium]|nr:hypothetical protein [Myxococcales bacterium]
MSLLLALALSTSVHAADGDSKPALPVVTVNALVYAHYGYTLDVAADHANSFELDRAYLGAHSQVSEHLSVKVLLDAGRLDDVAADTRYRIFLKNAWLEAASGKVIKARFGVVDTGYVPYAESFIGGRYISKMFADEQKLQTTADIGVNAQGEVGGGLVSWHGALLNGEGFSKPEIDAGKTGTARVSVDPLSKSTTLALPITGYVSYSLPGTEGADGVTVAVGAIGVKVPYVRAWAEYAAKMTGGVSSGGLSVTVSPSVPEVGGLVLRVDRFDADSSASGDSSMKILAGVHHDFLPKVSAALAYQRIQPEVGDETHGVMLSMQAGF